MPTASYKSYNLTRCPIFVLYLTEEGICPIFSLKMSYKSYNLGVLSYNYFQIHVQPAYIDKFRQNFSPLRGNYVLSIIIFYTPVCHSTFLDAKISPATRQFQIQPLCTREYNYLNKTNVFMSVKLVNNVNEYNKNSVYDVLKWSQNVLYFVEDLSYNPIFFSWKIRGHPGNFKILFNS